MRHLEDESGLVTISPNDTTIECGFEMGDWLSYISAGRETMNAQYRTKTAANGTVSYSHEVSLASGSFVVDQHENISSDSIRRRFQVTSDGPSLLGDFVLRFSIPQSSDAKAVIDQKEFKHQGLNRYLQFETETACIEWKKDRFEIDVLDVSTPPGLDFVIYVRDEPPDTWILHVRAIARDGYDGVLRFHRGPISHVPQIDRLVSRSRVLSIWLRNLREQSSVPPKYIPLQYGERARLSDSETLEMNIKATYYKE